MKNILFITEHIDLPYDEGIKKSVSNIANDLTLRCNLKIISRYIGYDNPFQDIADKYNGNRLFLSLQLFKKIKAHNPSLIIYFPFQSATLASFIRTKILYLRFPRKDHILIALQPKPLSSLERLITRSFLRSANVYTPSPTLKKNMSSLSIKSVLFPLSTNLNDFSPLKDESEKNKLRAKYNLPLNQIIVLHVGHLTINRNLDSLIPLQSENVQVLIVDSSSTPSDVNKDNILKARLIDKGIIIINQYIPTIRDIYNLADVYVFPCIEKNSSIGLPLSVLEARACGLPVITTNFEGIQEFLKDDNESILYSNPEDFQTSLKQIVLTLGKRDYGNTYVSELNKQYLKIVDQIVS